MMKRAASDRRPRVVTIPAGDTHKFAMSAIPPKADIAGRQLDVRFVPKADMVGLQGSLLGLSYAANLGLRNRGRT